jgi:hypothetical protein
LWGKKCLHSLILARERHHQIIKLPNHQINIMKTPLIPISVSSIYFDRFGKQAPLPERMAKCTPDTYNAIMAIADALQKKGGQLILSDLFRSYEMQTRSNLDYLRKKKKAFSPPPGGSFHEAGRSFDLDLDTLDISLHEFWKIAAAHGVTPIIKQPKQSLAEAWHFDCMGSHGIVYQYYANKKGNNLKPYAAAAASAILSIGVHVDLFAEQQLQASIQSALIRLGKDIGNMDGKIGGRTRQALEELRIRFDPTQPGEMLMGVEELLAEKFPAEFGKV